LIGDDGRRTCRVSSQRRRVGLADAEPVEPRPLMCEDLRESLVLLARHVKGVSYLESGRKPHNIAPIHGERPQRDQGNIEGRPPSKTNGSKSDTAPPPIAAQLQRFSRSRVSSGASRTFSRATTSRRTTARSSFPCGAFRRLDCVSRTKVKVLAKHEELKKAKHPRVGSKRCCPEPAGLVLQR